MNIAPISYNSNPSFGITSKVRIPMKDGTTLLMKVTGNSKDNGYINFTKICGDIMSKGKSIGKAKEISDKKGIDLQDLAVYCEELGKGAKEPDTIVDKFFEAIDHPTFDYNA